MERLPEPQYLEVGNSTMGDDHLIAGLVDAGAEIDRLQRALAKIDAIRNSIVSLQTLNWSEHIYPLVAALEEAGVNGKPYPADRKYLGSVIEQRDRLRRRVAELEERLKATSERAEKAP